MLIGKKRAQKKIFSDLFGKIFWSGGGRIIRIAICLKLTSFFQKFPGLLVTFFGLCLRNCLPKQKSLKETNIVINIELFYMTQKKEYFTTCGDLSNVLARSIDLLNHLEIEIKVNFEKMEAKGIKIKSLMVQNSFMI